MEQSSISADCNEDAQITMKPPGQGGVLKGAFSSQEFRNRLGRFPTGVGVVTTCSPMGERAGLTINSFVSLSLEPPLIAWSLSVRSANLKLFRECQFFGVSILASHQESIARRFASSSIKDKFDGVAIGDSLQDVPFIRGAIATFLCKSHQVVEVGDHLLLVGNVLHIDGDSGMPLVFHQGGFANYPGA